MLMAPLDRLAEPVRRWIWQQNWTRLRDVQEKAIPAILAGGDVVISARTAAGKTEAAFLPLLTRIVATGGPDMQGFAALYVAPLKALINDQYRRLEALCEACAVPLHRWHGDVSAEVKKRVRDRPTGIILITPESLEATLVRRGRDSPRFFRDLEAVVIDELHAFIGSERGMQLQSILTRIEVAAGRERIDRIGLSATLGDMGLAADALRPRGGDRVTLIHGDDPGNGLRLQVRGYEVAKTDVRTTTALEGDAEDARPEAPPLVPPRLAGDLFRLLRGKTNLLFAGSRDRVEIYADTLRAMCEETALPNEFFPHHGNLAKAAREDLEIRLRDDPRPTTAVATTTLELGIDIGDVDSVAQIGPGVSVASLRQRLGRSGRRAGRPAVLRIFSPEFAVGPGANAIDRLHLDLVQAIAMIVCLEEGWCEPPNPTGLHLSTLIHQILATVCQTGGIRPATAWKLLCDRGPFWTVSKPVFADLLRAMARPQARLIEQSPDGLLMIGEQGEAIAEAHDFYAVFATPVEYRIVHAGRTLGTKPMDVVVAPGQTMIFSGRRWRIVTIDDEARVITVESTRRALPPSFSGDWGGVHDRLVATMRAVLASTEIPAYLDAEAARLLAEARSAWVDLRLAETSIVADGSGVLLFPWVGTRKLETFALALTARGFLAGTGRHAIAVDNCSAEGVRAALEALSREPPPDPRAIVEHVSKPERAKFDHFLTEDLMNLVVLAERLDIESIPVTAARSLAFREV